jgi:ferredoxin-nitrate reductase
MSQSTKTYTSTCSYCGVGCGVKIHKAVNGSLQIEGDKSYPANQGMLCSKGMNLHYAAMDQTDRLLYPEMRGNRNMPLQRVSWDTALDRAAAVFKALIEKYGPDSVGYYVSGQCLTEEYYIANKITKGFIGTNNIDTNSRLCMSSAVVGYKLALGEDSVPLSYDDIELADCFFITGANPAWCHPILFRRLENHKAANPHVKIIVADPRKTQSCSLADVHLQLQPGTDIVLCHAIARRLIETGKIDQAFIDAHTSGYEAFKEKVFTLSLQEAADICVLEKELIIQAADMIGDSQAFISMWAMGLNQSVIGVNKNVSLLNLSLITGQIGKPGAGPLSLTGQPNAMGGREVGGLSNMLPAHKNLLNPAHRKEVADFWGVPAINEKPGFTATEMFDQLLSGKMKAVWIICTNPLVSLPDARNAEAALRNARFVVVQDISNKSDTLKYADLVLPAAAYMEKEGVMTNSDRRISYLSKVMEPPGEALPDVDILCRFAHKMGWKESFNYASNAEIFEEYTRITKGTNIDISGLSYADLIQRRSVQWPVPEKGHPGTPRLFTDHTFYTPTGLANIISVDSMNHSEKLDDYFPLILTTGRIRDQWHTMTRTGKVRKLNKHISKPFLEIHPEDAAMRGIKQDDVVTIESRRGDVRVTAILTEDIKKGVVFLPMHWGRMLSTDLTRTNNVTNNLIDPVSKEPDYKFTAVQVTKYVKPREHIVIVGAGAASCQFIKRHRELGAEDTITVFSAENFHFYNRVLLPEYVSKHKSWDNLEKLRKAEWLELGVTLIPRKITRLITESKSIVDDTGEVHYYDRLLVATGSRSTQMKHIAPVKGIFTMRRREDADALIHHLSTGDSVVVVGGGLLGLEMADSLVEIGMKVSVIQRSSRLMDRQLDKTAANLLAKELTERGMDLYFDDEVLYVNGEYAVESLRLKSSRKIDCKAILFAIGTQPNVEFLKEAGIQVNRGAIVDEHLQTSNEFVYAMGEIAERNGALFGITAGAEEQATVLAEYLNGSTTSNYTGTLSMNILKVHGVELCSIGMVEAPPNNPDYEEIIFLDKTRKYYKKCIVYQDRLVGAILMGDKSEFNEFRDWIKSGVELGEKRESLLMSGSISKEPMLGTLVCSCNTVGSGNIENAIKGGCKDVTSICNTTGAGSGCGSCKPEVKVILERMHAVTESSNSQKTYA